MRAFWEHPGWWPLRHCDSLAFSLDKIGVFREYLFRHIVGVEEVGGNWHTVQDGLDNIPVLLACK